MPSDIWAKWLDEADREGAACDRQQRVLHAQIRERVLHKAALGRGSRVLDLGCGIGFIALRAARVVGAEGLVYAVDSSPGALEELGRRAESLGLENLRALQADILSLPLPDEAVDAVVSRSVLCYVGDRPRALREAMRVLRPGGRLSIFEPVLSEETLSLDWGGESGLWSELRRALGRHHPAFAFGRPELLRAVREAGFREVDSFTWHADVTRRFDGEEAARRELESSLPEELSLASIWRGHGGGEEELARLARRWAEQSLKPSYLHTLPCIYIWGRKAPREGGEGEEAPRSVRPQG